MHKARFLVVGHITSPVVWHGTHREHMKPLDKPHVAVHRPKELGAVYRIIGEDDTHGCDSCRLTPELIDNRSTKA